MLATQLPRNRRRADLQQLLTGLLMTLADIEFERELEVRKVANSNLPDALKRSRVEHVERQFAERSASYRDEIKRLEQRIAQTLRRAA